MKKLKTISYLLMGAILLLSCSKENQLPSNRNVEIKNILYFENVNEYFKTLDKLDKMSNSDLMEWKKINTNNSFFDYHNSAIKRYQNEDFTSDFDPAKISELPTSYQILLNRKGQIQIGDSVVCYNRGVKYHLPAKDADSYDVNNITNNQRMYNKSSYTIQPPKQGGNIGERISVGTQWWDASNQFEFYQQVSPQGCRKFVHVLQTVRDQWQSFSGSSCGSGYTYRTGVFVVLKMEWKRCNRGRWSPAGDFRFLKWNLNYNINLRGVSLPCSSLPEEIYTFSGNITSRPWSIPLTPDAEHDFAKGSDYWLGIAYVSGNTKSNATNLYWEISLNGLIHQRVGGDVPANHWNNYVNW